MVTAGLCKGIGVGAMKEAEKTGRGICVCHITPLHCGIWLSRPAAIHTDVK